MAQSFVKRRGDFTFDPGVVIVLDPQLGMILLYEVLNHCPALCCLIFIDVEGRNPLVRNLLWIVVQISGEQDRTGFGEFQKQRLMPGRVSGSELDHNGTIAEHIAILTFQQDRFALCQFSEESWSWYGS